MGPRQGDPYTHSVSCLTAGSLPTHSFSQLQLVPLQHRILQAHHPPQEGSGGFNLLLLDRSDPPLRATRYSKGGMLERQRALAAAAPRCIRSDAQGPAPKPTALILDTTNSAVPPNTTTLSVGHVQNPAWSYRIGLSAQRAELPVFRRPKGTLLSLCKGKV